MRIFITKSFRKWADKTGLNNDQLINAIDEISRGLSDASYGANLYKKRIAISSKGKSSGVRTLIAIKLEDKVFYLYGFKKKDKGNITKSEENVYKFLAKKFLNFSDKELNTFICNGSLIEIREENG